MAIYTQRINLPAYARTYAYSLPHQPTLVDGDRYYAPEYEQMYPHNDHLPYKSDEKLEPYKSSELN